MMEFKNTILYCVVLRTFVIPFYYGSGTVNSYGSGSNILTSYGSTTHMPGRVSDPSTWKTGLNAQSKKNKPCQIYIPGE
jgi:hypothetical protein